MRRTWLPPVILAGALVSGPAQAEPPRLPDGLPLYAHPTSLSVVAKRFGLGVDEIAALNQIADPHVFNRTGVVLPLTARTAKLPRFVAWREAPERRTCSSPRWPFEPKQLPGCDRAFCARGPQETEVCACFHRESAATVSMRAGRGPSWVAELPPSLFRGPGPESFDVASADFDQDGTNEVLISWLEGESNGIAAQSRTLVVVREGRELVRYDSGEFTAATAAVLVEGRCRTAASHYTDVDDPIRGSALHLVERTFDPLRLTADPEIVARRFSDRARVVLPFDPELPRGGRKSVVTISATTRSDEGALATLSLRPTTARAAAPAKLSSSDLQLGDATRKRLFPPALVWPGLVGQKARAIRPAEGQPTVIWLAR